MQEEGPVCAMDARIGMRIEMERERERVRVRVREKGMEQGAKEMGKAMGSIAIPGPRRASWGSGAGHMDKAAAVGLAAALRRLVQTQGSEALGRGNVSVLLPG